MDVFTPYMAGLFSRWEAVYGKVLVLDQADLFAGTKGSDGRKRKLQYAVGPSSAQSDVPDIKTAGQWKEEESEPVVKKRPSLVVFEEEKEVLTKSNSMIVGHKLKPLT